MAAELNTASHGLDHRVFLAALGEAAPSMVKMPATPWVRCRACGVREPSRLAICHVGAEALGDEVVELMARAAVLAGYTGGPSCFDLLRRPICDRAHELLAASWPMKAAL